MLFRSIGSVRKKARKKKKVGGKSFLPIFKDDANMATLKAHEVLFVDDPSPLMAKSSSELMSSHIRKLVQVSVAVFFFCRLWGSLCSS